MKKRVISMLLAAVMTVSMVSGTVMTAAAEEAEGKQLSVQVGPDPETIDPALNSAVDGGNMILHLFEGLLTVDQDGQLAPGQAETWETSEDGLTWTFHLREGLKWSDGTDLTANDFVYSWKRVCDPELAAPYAETVLGMVEGYDAAIEGDLDALGVTAVDDLTFEVKLAKPCTYFGELAAFATLSPVQQATVEANGDAWAVEASTFISNGPFYITEWVPGSHIITSKNPNYWNADAIKLGSIKWNLIEDSNAAYSAYLNGDVLMIKDVPTEEIPSLEGNEEFHVEPIVGTYYISYNTQVEPLNDANVRKALNLAIDREYVAGTLMQGTYTAAPNFMGPGWKDTDGSDFYENANNGEPYMPVTADIEGALAALEEAGYPNGEGLPVLHYITNDAGYHKVVAEYLQQAWKEIGVTLEVEIVEWSSFTPMRRQGDFEIARNGWVGDYSDPSNQLELLYSTNGNNDGKYSSEAFDAAIDLSRETVDPEERSAALHEAEDIMMADSACCPLAYYNDFWLQSSKITGSWHSATGYWYFMYADIEE
ncbi:MAG: peptide ABC transporter substrate-binding protein [Lachnospiraceae bacterium]|nr:peptide ABC transporter substrate-binding protein [Lachnospiraceae bacterium]MDD7078795.1 peptide ABC transporter substrate-binding protein [Lachnospiraceae bacterium]MDY3728991.1 peptide ABC transporter substrate-binding protein [Candidatus Choladocola sp.]